MPSAFGLSIPPVFPTVDTFIISGIPIPGKWILVSAPKKFGWQQQAGFQFGGAILLPASDPLIPIKFRGEIWSEDDFLAFDAVRAKLLIKPVVSIPGIPKTAAPSIYHPELQALGVDAVVIEEITPMTQSEAGLWVGEISLLQYRPPKPLPAKPERSTPKVPGVDPNAKDAKEVEILALKAEKSARDAELARKIPK